MELHLKKVSACVIVGTTILSSLTANVSADENKLYTDHDTYYIDKIEYNMDGTLVDETTHQCNYVFDDEVVNEEEKTDDTQSSDENKSEEFADSVTEGVTENSSTSDKINVESNTSNESNTNNYNYVVNTWYHPTNINPSGYIGEINGAIKEDSFLTRNWDKFKVDGNPFALGQCTYFAWSRFYQVYGFDSGARGNGKTNAMEIVNAHPDKFTISSTPSAGAVFSCEKNTLYPEYGHVGFIEAYDGTYVWISEGNYKVGDTDGYIYLHKMTWESFKAQYPDVVFAVPNEGVLDETNTENTVTMDDEDEVKTETKKVYTLVNKTVTAKKVIYDEDGNAIQQFNFSTSSKDKNETQTKTVSVSTIYDENGKILKTYK